MILKRQIRQLEQEIADLEAKIKTTEERFGLGHEEVVDDYKLMLVERKELLEQLKWQRQSA